MLFLSTVVFQASQCRDIPIEMIAGEGDKWPIELDFLSLRVCAPQWPVNNLACLFCPCWQYEGFPVYSPSRMRVCVLLSLSKTDTVTETGWCKVNNSLLFLVDILSRALNNGLLDVLGPLWESFEPDDGIVTWFASYAIILQQTYVCLWIKLWTM